ncbi:MAG: DOMON domain-containing protein [Armatimonadota bacterium]
MLPDAFDFADTPQLFLDDTLIADAVGLERRVHRMTKLPEPVLHIDPQTEGNALSPMRVAYDAALGQWRMWYDAYGKRPLLGQMQSVHMAVSADGITWEKPALGASPLLEGKNNLCVFEDGSPIPGGCTVFDESDDPDPAKRYKLIYYPGYNYYLAYSADGVRWRKAQQDPVWSNGDGDGLEETYFFTRDEKLGKYRGYMRVWQRHQTIRKTSVGESDDLLHWSGPKIIWEAEPAYGLGAQLYGMNVFYDGGLYWALPWIFYTDQPLDEDLQQTMRLKLAWSRDGIEWHALVPEQDAVPIGAPGDFDCGMMLSSCPVVRVGDRLRLYYYGSSTRHDRSDINGVAQVGLAEIRPHGFVSLHAEGEGRLITRRFLFRGEGICINARTAPDGCIMAEILSDKGEVVQSRSFTRSDPFTGDAIDHRLTWGDDGSLASLFGQNIMLRLKLYQADLFSFMLDGPPERFIAPLGPPPVRCGRCLMPPVIDGRLSDQCWQDFSNSGTADDFVKFTEISPAPLKTRAMFTRDDEHLYISVDCEEPEAEKLVFDRPDNNIEYSRDDVIEFRLSAPGQGTHFNQLMITPAGGKWQAWFSVEEGGVAVNDNPEWTVKTSHIPGRWYAEMVVPFSALNTPPPAPGEPWQLNIIRHRHVAGANDISCWSCMYGSVHRNDRSGMLVFV